MSKKLHKQGNSSKLHNKRTNEPVLLKNKTLTDKFMKLILSV